VQVSLIVRPQELPSTDSGGLEWKRDVDPVRSLYVVFTREIGRSRIIRPRSFGRLARVLGKLKPTVGLIESGGRYPASMWMTWRIQ